MKDNDKRKQGLGRGRRARTPVPTKNLAIKLSPEQHEKLMQMGKAAGFSAASMIVGAILERYDLGPDLMNRKLPPSIDMNYKEVEPDHLVKYDQLYDLNNVLLGVGQCKCQFCQEPMERTDIRKRYDKYTDGGTVFETYELFYECGNGSCNTGTRTILEVGVSMK